MNEIYLQIIGGALTLLVAYLSRVASARWNIQIEASRRDALHSALLTGARLALERKLDGKAAIQLILGYVHSSVPDALDALKPPTHVLEDLAQSKMQEAAQAIGGDKLADALNKALRE